jgi:uncharacterized lipoprotein YddW (UPF0748 family)
MRKCIIILVAFVFLLTSCTSTENAQPKAEKAPQSAAEGINAVWINYNELAMKSETDKSEAAFRKKAEEIMKNCSEFGFDRVIVQVRPFCDAFYKSDLFPASEYLSGSQGVYVGYDVLRIMCEYARKYSLKIDAWLNPYRVSYKSDINVLCEDNIARKWYCSEENNRNVIVLASGIYFNPTKDAVHKLIVDGVREILNNYDVDGVHIDDYFYPTTDASFDEAEYSTYTSSGGKMFLDEWRRENVNSLVSDIHTAVKAKNENLIFSISPSGDIEKNVTDYYADIPEWCETGGYADWIIPQLYYGFNNENKPFEEVCLKWLSLERSETVKLSFGLAVYKYGREDKYAGSGMTEWQENTDIISRQISYFKTQNINVGFVLYSYSYIFSENFVKSYGMELQTIKNMIQ